MDRSAERDLVFVSYSHKDDKWRKRLQVHLKPMMRSGTIEAWDDTRIRAGEDWRNAIAAALRRARVAVLLVSPDFLASDFIAHKELPPLLAAAKAEDVRILWILVGCCAWKETAINAYKAVHPPERPLAKLRRADVDEALVAISQSIRQAFEGDVVSEPYLAIDRGAQNKREEPRVVGPNSHRGSSASQEGDHASFMRAGAIKGPAAMEARASKTAQPVMRVVWLFMLVVALGTAVVAYLRSDEVNGWLQDKSSTFSQAAVSSDGQELWTLLEGWLLHSTDGARTWKKEDGERIRGISIVRNSNSRLLLATDWGLEWPPEGVIRRGIRECQRVRHLEFLPDGLTGWATCGNMVNEQTGTAEMAILKTTDGGQNWQHVSLHAPWQLFQRPLHARRDGRRLIAGGNRSL